MADKSPYFVHDSSYVDEPCEIGDGTKIHSDFVNITSGIVHLNHDSSVNILR